MSLVLVLGLVLFCGSGLNSNSGLVRDRFGLHKLVIAVTRPGKVLAIDSLTGRVVWQRLPWRHLVDAGDAQLTLLVQRTSAHYALEPQCLVVASRRGHPSSLFAFQPVTGRQVALLSLDYAIDQVAHLPTCLYLVSPV